MSHSSRAVAIGLAAVVVVGCAGDGGPPVASLAVVASAPRETVRATPTKDPSTIASPASSEIPLVPPPPSVEPSGPRQGSMPNFASDEADGVRLTLEIHGNPVYAGQRVAVKTTIENRGPTAIEWLNDGCDHNAGVSGSIVTPFPDHAMDIAGSLVRWRDLLREEARVGRPITLEARSGVLGGLRRYGCADLGNPRSLEPGTSVTQTAFWDGNAAPRLGLPPNGPATWTATFERWNRRGSTKAGRTLTATLRSWIIGGRREDAISPAAAIDAALGDERFASWLVRQAYQNGTDAIAEYDRSSGLWIIGLLIYTDDPAGAPWEDILHAAYVDPITGDVVAIRETPVQPF